MISAFILFTLLSANAISLSHYPQLKEAVLKKLEPVAALTGLGQNWTMFSPAPRKMNFHTNALIQYQDGSLRLVELPRFEKMTPVEKFKHYKLRKLFNDVVVNEIGEKYRPSIARYLVYSHYSKENPVKKVSLDFNFDALKPPDQVLRKRAEKSLHLNKSTIFVYSVGSRELSKALSKSR